MALQLLDSTTTTSSSITYTVPKTGSNRCLVVAISGNADYGSNSVYYGFNLMTQQIQQFNSTFGWYSGVAIYTLTNPPTGANALTGLGVNSAIMTWGNVSQSLPVWHTSTDKFSVWTHDPSYGISYWGLNFGSESSADIDIYALNYSGNLQTADRHDSVFTAIGSYCSYLNTPTGIPQSIWYQNVTSYVGTPSLTMVGIQLKESADFSVSSTLSLNGNESLLKGIVFNVVSSIKLSGSYSQIKKVIFSVSSTLKLKGRGWWGKVLFWKNPTKDNTTWTNKTKS